MTQVHPPTEGHENTAPNAFEKWISERPKWLQTAAATLIEQRRSPSDQELTQLADLCIAEASGESAGFSTVVPGSLGHAAKRPSLCIRKLHDVRGVNVIKEGASLEFGSDSLSVIYGSNGSGKTGFSRLLKVICGSRAKDDIYGNVFNDTNPPIEAKVDLTIAGDTKALAWSAPGEPMRELRDVHVFDTKTASQYVTKDNEATYEPSRMRFVSSLIKVSDQVAERLEAKRQALVSKLPAIPPELSKAPAMAWVSNLSATTKRPFIDDACAYSKELDNERIATESILAQQDAGQRLEAIGQEIKVLDQLRTDFADIKSGLSDERLQSLLLARHDALAKRLTASEDAKKVFASSPLDGVGQESWKALWTAAKAYSEAHAYPESSFPVTYGDAKCVLCQQELDQAAKDRLGHFETFVIGALEASAKAAESNLETLQKELPTLPEENDWAMKMMLIKIPEAEATALLVALKARRAASNTAKDMAEIPDFNWTTIEQALANITLALQNEESGLKALQQDGKRNEMEARVLNLRALQWLNQQKDAIIAEVDRRVVLARIEKAIKTASTTALTKKNSELAEQELAAGYQDRFIKELERLGGGRLSVRPVRKTLGKGKVTFGLTLHGAKQTVAIDRILSEGEMRIVALAAFLADITGTDQSSPFVFDDPISSLDQDFEERVVNRLIELAKFRQVIVFTHRLSLLALLEDGIKKLKVQADFEKVKPAVELHLTTLRRLGNTAGLTSQFSVREEKPQKAINRLRDESVAQLRRLHEEGDVLAYEERVKGVCSDLRILVERCVESVLLNDVLLRFRRSLQTQNKIGALARILPSDCSLIDDLMTRYSVFEHSQSDELPAAVPDFLVIKSDIESLANWITEFTGRAVPTTA